jgi:hypothetical protein
MLHRGEQHMKVTTLPRELALMSVFGIAALMTHTSQAKAGVYVQTNPVSDFPAWLPSPTLLC